MSEEIKKGILPQILMIITAILLFVITFYFLVAINTKIKEAENIGEKNTISVAKTGTIYVKPDMATTTITVTTDATTASEAITKNREKSSAVISFLKEQGLQDADIKTVNYNVYPKYEYYDLSSSAYYRNQRIAGYTATESLEIKIKDLEKIGDITTGAVSAGASNIGDLRFTVEDSDSIKMQARTQAIEKSKIDAQSIANGLGVVLGEVVGFSESGYLPVYYDTVMKSSVSGMGGAIESQPVSVGENKIEVTVTVTYEIK